ncbi:Translin [Limtongia smithiae]|uniref:Translin n=1 Tax=Limtongia smithiae TaxID=1125753 RepID=UPI0034CE7439
MADTVPKESDPNTERVTALFSSARILLDQHHDARDSIIKASRDITAASKKLIFALQRLKAAPDAQHGWVIRVVSVDRDIIALETKIREIFASVEQLLSGLGAWRYQRQITGAIQEFIEAITFREYLYEGRIMTYINIKKTLPSSILLTYEDYVLGLFDLTGELMRFAISNIHVASSLNGAIQPSAVSLNIRLVLQTLLTEFSALRIPQRSNFSPTEYQKKLSTLSASVSKVEKAVYSLSVRGSELPADWSPDDEPAI